MNLEPELIKEILEWSEQNLPEKEYFTASELKIKKYTSAQIIFHVGLLIDNKYIKAFDASADNRKDYLLLSLTMDGYQYLNLLKSKAWNTAKALLHEGGVIFAEAAINSVIAKLNIK